ncbi:MAG: hypothetical protein JRH20_20035 [Deltaproteobacteria bacterium]|nr:hypothetical protein [Deltaproteobacteria bacterium]
MQIALCCLWLPACSYRPIDSHAWEVHSFDKRLSSMAVIGGTVWVTSVCNGLFRWDGDTFRRSNMGFDTPGMDQISACPDGTAWGRQGSKLCQFDGLTWQHQASPGRLTSVHCASHTRAWATTSHSVHRFSAGQWGRVFTAEGETAPQLAAIWGPSCDTNRAWVVGINGALQVTATGTAPIAALEHRMLTSVTGYEGASCQLDVIASGNEVWRRKSAGAGEVWQHQRSSKPLLLEQDSWWSSEHGVLIKTNAEGEHRDEELLADLDVGVTRWLSHVARDAVGRLWVLGHDTMGAGCGANAMWPDCCQPVGSRSFVARRRDLLW